MIQHDLGLKLGKVHGEQLGQFLLPIIQRVQMNMQIARGVLIIELRADQFPDGGEQIAAALALIAV